MKRQYKFRAWDEKLKCMHATDSVSLCIDGEICYLDTDGEWVADMANRITLMQYTGLTDKNGTEIYEGDILKDTLGWVFEVRWDNENGRFLGYHSKPRGDIYICYIGREPESTIIGNIWENPELLK